MPYFSAEFHTLARLTVTTTGSNMEDPKTVQKIMLMSFYFSE